MENLKFYLIISIFTFCILSFLGCTFIFQTGRRSDIEKIEELSRQLEELNQTKRLLEERLSKEIADNQVRVQMMQKGLVITFVADVLFDSGRAEIRPEAYPILDKVARVLRENVPHLNVGIEGHTDNQPIRYSGWKSNWELSAARALSVLHYLVDQQSISPERLVANGYGEYRPVASNDTKEGRQLNRRVEIVILPQITKVRESVQKEIPSMEKLK
ncbi:MAG: OmpA family protein [Candidatus Omnitrophica bacterium]|nr:OmpA family protein [Candidatus Omnitrophota bacterium]